MSKPYDEMDADERRSCQEKIDFLTSIGFKPLPNQTTPRLIHPDLPGEVWDVYDLNPLQLVMKIYNLGAESVNKIIEANGNQG